MEGQRRIDWFGLIIGVIWLLAAVLIFVLYQTGGLSATFPIPRILGLIYDKLGIVAGSAIQFVLSGLLIFFSVRRKAK